MGKQTWKDQSTLPKISKLENRRERSEPGHPWERSASLAAVSLGHSCLTQSSELLLATPSLLESTHQTLSNRDSKSIYKCVCVLHIHISCLISPGKLKLKIPLRAGTSSLISLHPNTAWDKWDTQKECDWPRLAGVNRKQWKTHAWFCSRSADYVRNPAWQPLSPCHCSPSPQHYTVVENSQRNFFSFISQTEGINAGFLLHDLMKHIRKCISATWPTMRSLGLSLASLVQKHLFLTTWHVWNPDLLFPFQAQPLREATITV